MGTTRKQDQVVQLLQCETLLVLYKTLKSKEDLNTQRKTAIKPGMIKFLPATYNTDHNKQLSKLP